MSDDFALLGLGVFIGGLLGLFAGIAGETIAWRAETVERGLAIYCPQNGQWAWIGECGDE